MSMAKRQQDLKDPGVRERIAEQLRPKEDNEMAEQLKVSADGEHVVLVAEGEAGTCEVRLTLEEAEQFEEALQKATTRVSFRVEARRVQEGMKIHGVEDDDEDPGQGVAE
jgi:hypothetical protein